jgi:hypothetical protein
MARCIYSRIFGLFGNPPKPAVSRGVAVSPSNDFKRWVGWAVCAACVLAAARLEALTMGDLLGDTKMTPKRFASLFEDFKFEVHPFDVQNPSQFLGSRCGDCIDYAVLADYILKRRGYGTRLIRVEMMGENMGHAVCYVTESRAYLDYNNRRYAIKLQRSGRSIREIANEVADSFDANWTFAQEFTFDYTTYIKRAVFTVVKTDTPTMDPDLANSSAAPKKPNP